MSDAQEESKRSSQKNQKPSWVSLLLDIASRHAQRLWAGASRLLGPVEEISARCHAVYSGAALGMLLLFIGFGFVVFGIGMTLVEVFVLTRSGVSCCQDALCGNRRAFFDVLPAMMRRH